MPKTTKYETGARHPVAKKRPDANEEFSQDAATNKPPKSGVGNSDAPPVRNPNDPHPRDVREDPSPDPKKANKKPALPGRVRSQSLRAGKSLP